MRDNHQDLLELVDVSEKEGHYFCKIQLEKGGERQQFQFGISYEAYSSLQKMFQSNPFDQMPGLKRRYFFVPAYQRLNADYMSMTVRIEQQKQGKQFTFPAPNGLVANIKWFTALSDWNAAMHLRIDA